MDEELTKSEPEESESEETAKSVSSDLIRGHINTIILRALYEGDKYGYEIIADIENKSHGQYSLKQPSLYSALKRLEKDGCITSYWGGSVSGGRRKYFSLTDLGKEISERNQSEWEYSRTIIDSLISDKDFDFNNPAPNNVDMRILRDTTSRVPRDPGEEEEESITRFASTEFDAKKAELENAENALRERIETLRREQEWREDELAIRESNLEKQREELKNALANGEKSEELDSALRDKEQELALAQHLNETLKNELNAYEEQAEELKLRIIEEERERSQTLLDAEKARYESALSAERSRIAAEENRRANEYIAAETARIQREQERIYLQREQELMRQNYRELVSAPAPEQSAAIAQPQQSQPAPEPAYVAPTAEEKPASEAPVYESNPLPFAEDDLPAATQDGVDFSEIEQRAALDGIRIATTGTKAKRDIQTESSVSLVHKGKALFMSSIVACAFCIVLGSILLGVQTTVAIPAFFPYVIWCVGLAILLAMGLAYANHYGERAIRRNSFIVLINVAVIYALCVIFTLIVALSAKIDFSDVVAVASFIYIPIVFELTIPVFGVVYYFLVRAK